MAWEEDDCLGGSRGDEEWMSVRGNAWVPRWEDIVTGKWVSTW